MPHRYKLHLPKPPFDFTLRVGSRVKFDPRLCDSGYLFNTTLSVTEVRGKIVGMKPIVKWDHRDESDTEDIESLVHE